MFWEVPRCFSQSQSVPVTKDFESKIERIKSNVLKLIFDIRENHTFPRERIFKSDCRDRQTRTAFIVKFSKHYFVTILHLWRAVLDITLTRSGSHCPRKRTDSIPFGILAFWFSYVIMENKPVVLLSGPEIQLLDKIFRIFYAGHPPRYSIEIVCLPGTTSCYYSWAHRQIFVCLHPHADKADGSDPSASFVCQNRK